MRTDAILIALCWCEIIALVTALVCSLRFLKERWARAVPWGCEIGALVGLNLLISSILINHLYCAVHLWLGGALLMNSNPGAILMRVLEIVGLVLLARPLLERAFGSDWVPLTFLAALLITLSSGATLLVILPRAA